MVRTLKPCITYSLLPLSPLSLSLSWSLGPQEALGAFSSLGPSVRHSGALFSLLPSPPLLPLAPYTLSLPGLLGPPWGLRKPWEPLKVFSSLGSSVRLRDLVPLASLPPYPWASLGPWNLPGISGSLGSLWQPWVFSQTWALFLLSPHPLAPWASGSSLGPQEALGAFRSLWQPWVFRQLRGLVFPCFLSLLDSWDLPGA